MSSTGRLIATGASTLAGALALVTGAHASIAVNRSVAGVGLGMTAKEVRSKLGRPSLSSAGNGARNLVYRPRALVVTLIGGRVAIVSTRSRRERTAAGVGVGGTTAAVRDRVRGALRPQGRRRLLPRGQHPRRTAQHDVPDRGGQGGRRDGRAGAGLSAAGERDVREGGPICVIAAAGVHVGDLLDELDRLGLAHRRLDLAGSAALAQRPAAALVVCSGDRPGAFARRACAALRARQARAPIVVVLPAGHIPIADPALDAHELLVRPLRAGELLSRIDRAIAAAAGREAAALSLRAGALRLDPGRRRVWIGERAVDLTVREFELLHHLARNPASVHSRAQLRDVVWDGDAGVGARAVDVLIRRVRLKLGDEQRCCIRTVRRVGYAFTTPI